MKAKTFKPKEKKCRYNLCGKTFVAVRQMQSVCSPICGIKKAQQAREALEKKEKRKAYLERKAKIKTRGDYIAYAQRDFNAYIRERDYGLPCICCNGLPHHGQLQLLSTLGGEWDAGHYRSRGAAPHLRFDERNVHAQLKRCNRYKDGNIVEYRIGLIKRIGLEAVEALECDQEPRKYTIDDLIALAKEYRKKRRELKKAREKNGN